MKWWKWFKIKFSWKIEPLWKSEGSDEIKQRINSDLHKHLLKENEKRFR